MRGASASPPRTRVLSIDPPAPSHRGLMPDACCGVRTPLVAAPRAHPVTMHRLPPRACCDTSDGCAAPSRRAWSSTWPHSAHISGPLTCGTVGAHEDEVVVKTAVLRALPGPLPAGTPIRAPASRTPAAASRPTARNHAKDTQTHESRRVLGRGTRAVVVGGWEPRRRLLAPE